MYRILLVLILSGNINISNAQSKDLFLKIWKFKVQVSMSEQTSAKLEKFKNDKSDVLDKIAQLESEYYADEGRSEEIKNQLLKLYKEKRKLVDSIKNEAINNQDEALFLDLVEFIRPEDLRKLLEFKNLDAERAKAYQQWLKEIANSEVGIKLKHFTLKNEEGELIKTEDLKGKIVWIDSWASKCKPCIKKLNQVKPVYNKYHHAGFEILAVSWDYTSSGYMKTTEAAKEDWKKIINRFDFNWINVFDEKDQIMNGYYGATGKNILVDKNGVIIAYDLKPLEIEQILEKELD